MASKKAKVDFSAEAILRKIHGRKELLNQINTLKGQLVLNEITDSLRSLRKHVNFDVVGLLAFMFGFDAIMWIMLAIRHVPKTFARYIENTRCNIIFTIIDHLCPCRFSVTLVDDIVCFLEEFAPESPFLGNYSAVFEEALCTLALTKISHNISYMKISYMKSLYGIETHFIYEMLCENFIYEIFHI